MLIDFRKDRTVIPAIKINDCVLERVSSCKLLGLWMDDDLKWKTNTEYIVKNVAKRLHFLKILKGYNAAREDQWRTLGGAKGGASAPPNNIY